MSRYFIYKKRKGGLWPYLLLKGREWPYGEVINVHMSLRAARRAARRDQEKRTDRTLIEVVE